MYQATLALMVTTTFTLCKLIKQATKVKKLRPQLSQQKSQHQESINQQPEQLLLQGQVLPVIRLRFMAMMELRLERSWLTTMERGR